MNSELEMNFVDFLPHQLQMQVAQREDNVRACLKNVHENLLKELNSFSYHPVPLLPENRKMACIAASS
jgi:hypothetical protein